MPLAKSGQVTLGIALVDYILFEIIDISKKAIFLRGVSCNNDTRPNADPRKAFVWAGQSGSTTGQDSSDGKIASGYVSVNGDLVKLLPKDFRMEPNEMIGFRFEGENLDVCNAKILFEVVK